MQMRPMPEDGSIFQPVHQSSDMQRSVPAERGNAASQQQRIDPQRSGGMVRRPLRTVPLIPLEGASGISMRKESAQAVWEYAGATDEIAHREILCSPLERRRRPGASECERWRRD